jgi:hypothetical protein
MADRAARGQYAMLPIAARTKPRDCAAGLRMSMAAGKLRLWQRWRGRDLGEKHARTATADQVAKAGFCGKR